MSSKRKRSDAIRADIVAKSTDILSRYCLPSEQSKFNLSQLLFLDKTAIKKISRDIESFIDSIMELADGNMDILDEWNMFDMCPHGLTKNQYCHLGSKKHPIKCLEMIEYDDMKRLIPQMYHILQDYGFFYIYLGVEHMRIEPKENESQQEKKTRLEEEKQDISTLITEKVSELCGDISINDMSFEEKYNAKIRCLRTMERRLQYILFLREFNVICCLRKKEEDDAHLSFNQVLDASCVAIHSGKRTAKRKFETAKKAAKMERVRNQLN